jgi:hypothetical protein
MFLVCPEYIVVSQRDVKNIKNELASAILTWENFTVVGNIGKSPNWPMCRHQIAKSGAYV